MDQELLHIHEAVFKTSLESSERYHRLVGAMRDVVFTLSPDGRFTSLNPAFETVTGWTCAEWLDKEFVPIVHPDDLSQAVEQFHRVLCGEEPPVFELRIHTRWGGYCVGEFLETPEKQDGQIIGLLGIARDITPRKQVEASLRLAHEELEMRVEERTRELAHANIVLLQQQRQLIQAAKLASIGELATGVAHELNNPLNNMSLIVGNELEHLRDGEFQHERLVCELELVQQQIERAACIVNQLRTFGRSARHEMAPLSLHEILTSSLDLVRHQLQLNDITVRTEWADGSPRVLGDRVQIEQVFVNLLTNAHDALATAARKDIVITTRVRCDSVDIVIRDTGCGMGADIQERVFDPFFTTKAVGEGTGLGLSIAHGIIQSHKGTISVASAPGRGTAFTVSLPMVDLDR
jgi:PAS domain S-box-containing protein